jgi:nucleotide-binding universal stress UspA family protein
MYTRILVPLDGSELAEKALPQAEGLAKAYGATIHLLHAVSRLPILEATRAGGFETAQTVELSMDVARRQVEAQQTKGQMYLEQVAEGLRGKGIQVETALREGAADEQIIAYAKEHGVDLIVMSTHGYGGLRRFFLGSVTDRVVRSGEVPVLVVNPS